MVPDCFQRILEEVRFSSLPTQVTHLFPFCSPFLFFFFFLFFFIIKFLSFSQGSKEKTVVAVVVQPLSHVQLFATPWTVAHQAPLFMGFPRQEYWSGLPFPSPCSPFLISEILWQTFSVAAFNSQSALCQSVS